MKDINDKLDRIVGMIEQMRSMTECVGGPLDGVWLSQNRDGLIPVPDGYKPKSGRGGCYLTWVDTTDTQH